MNSNQTLRFQRTSREAFGHWASFSNRNKMDKMVFVACAIGAAFVIGMIVGGLK